MKIAFKLKDNWLWVLFIAVILLALMLMKIFSVTFNFTPSMPIGFYYKISKAVNLKVGEDVEVCLPEKIGKVGLKRGYIDEGSCPGGFEPIVKKLIAVPGDKISLTKKSIIVNGVEYRAPYIEYDMHGNHMIAYPIKEITSTNKYWLYGANDPKYSWDSRFYGGVEIQNIKGVVRPLFTSKTISSLF